MSSLHSLFAPNRGFFAYDSFKKYLKSQNVCNGSSRSVSDTHGSTTTMSEKSLGTWNGSGTTLSKSRNMSFAKDPDEYSVATKNKTEDDDPWKLPDLEIDTVEWSDLDTKGRIKRVAIGLGKFILLIALLYMFICSLGFLSDAFRLLGGKTAGRAFRESKILANPVAGLMVGVLVTVLVQSSSTSTSIVITMVASRILTVHQAVYIIMGANIGTTVTNTIVSLTQASERNEFRRAFGAATVHDMFNWITVAFLLPLEAASGYLERLSREIILATDLDNSNKNANKEFLKAITKPFTKLVIQIDKDVIEAVAINANDSSILDKPILKTFCPDKIKTNITTVFNETTNIVSEKEVVVNGTEFNRCRALFSQGSGSFVLGDTAAGVILLFMSIAILCICLVLIVKLLHSMLKGQIAVIIKKFLNNDFPGKLAFLTGYVAIFVGAGITILVQSSSIFTSALTPLVGMGLISIERMYPLTLGSNIGTTTTGILAALAADRETIGEALQLSFCHLFFNISGILMWYPIPIMRRVPINLAKKLGDTTATYRWFAVVYLILMFFMLPGIVFALSLAGWPVLLGIAGPIFLLFIFVVVVNILQSKKPNALPKKLRTWNWLPEPLRSLDPYDRALRSCLSRFTCCDKLFAGKDVESDDLEKGKSNSIPITADDKNVYQNKGFDSEARENGISESPKDAQQNGGQNGCQNGGHSNLAYSADSLDNGVKQGGKIESRL